MKKEIKATFNDKQEKSDYQDFKRIVTASKRSDSDIIKLALRDLIKKFKESVMNTPIGQKPAFLSDEKIKMKTEIWLETIRDEGGSFSHFAGHQINGEREE